jgi:hypothetical protein
MLLQNLAGRKKESLGLRSPDLVLEFDLTIASRSSFGPSHEWYPSRIPCASCKVRGTLVVGYQCADLCSKCILTSNDSI